MSSNFILVTQQPNGKTPKKNTSVNRKGRVNVGWLWIARKCSSHIFDTPFPLHWWIQRERTSKKPRVPYLFRLLLPRRCNEKDKIDKIKASACNKSRQRSQFMFIQILRRIKVGRDCGSLSLHVHPYSCFCLFFDIRMILSVELLLKE